MLTLRKPLGNPRCILRAEAVNRAKLCTLPEVRRPVGARNPPETHRKPLCFTLREPRRTPRCFICPEAVNLRRSRYASGTYEGRRTSPCGAQGLCCRVHTIPRLGSRGYPRNGHPPAGEHLWAHKFPLGRVLRPSCGAGV